MATTVTIETDKQLPPKGSLRRSHLENAVQTVVQSDLNDSNVKVNLVKKGR